jgi:hypothetical protein
MTMFSAKVGNTSHVIYEEFARLTYCFGARVDDQW